MTSNPKIYIASSTTNRSLIPFLSEWLDRLQFEVVGDWWCTEPIHSHVVRASIDFPCIDESDILLAVYEYGFGTATEVGYAIGSGKYVIYLVDEWTDDNSLFEGLVGLNQRALVVHNMEQLLKALIKWKKDLVEG